MNERLSIIDGSRTPQSFRSAEEVMKNQEPPDVFASAVMESVVRVGLDGEPEVEERRVIRPFDFTLPSSQSQKESK